MLGMKIAATGALLVLAAILVVGVCDCDTTPSPAVGIPVAVALIGGIASIFVGIILALWE